MRWIWDKSKARSNRLKHRLSFEAAQLVFDDPLAQSTPDPSAGEERWLTLGLVGNVAIVVVHTWPDANDLGRNRAHHQRAQGDTARKESL